MKISYISLRKKVKDMIESRREKVEKKSQKENNKEEETKFIGINYSKKDSKTNKKEKLNKILTNMKSAPKGSYTLVIFMFLLLAITAKLNMDTYKKLEEENYKTYGLEENREDITEVSNNNVVIYKEDVSSISDTNYENEKVIETSSNNTENSGKDELEEEKYVYEYAYLRPVKGNALKEYSMDKVIYSKTLDLWKVHDGIDIYAILGEEVVSSEKGIVERIYEDSFYGYSVIIDHQNGIKTIYRNLSKEISIKENEQVKKGQVIAKVGETSIGECKDEPHIHFEVVKNGEIVNPSIIGIK